MIEWVPGALHTRIHAFRTGVQYSLCGLSSRRSVEQADDDGLERCKRCVRLVGGTP